MRTIVPLSFLLSVGRRIVGCTTSGLMLLAIAVTAGAEVRVGTPKTPRELPSTAGGAPPKITALGGRLLVPYFEVDMGASDGQSTLFAIRNESALAVGVEVSFFAVDRPHAALGTESFEVAPKAVRSILVRNVPDLLVDADGFARGYAVVQAADDTPVLHGDYFQITPGEGFATGHRLVNIDPGSADNELCATQTLRFLNGGPFDGGTDLVVWIETDTQPDLQEPVLTYAVYNEAGDLIFVNDLFSDQVAMRVPVSVLVAAIPTSFGALELQFNNTVGHASVVMSALGLYSVGFEGTCTN